MKSPYDIPESPEWEIVEEGESSWYSRATNSPKGTGITASGIEMFDDGYTAAHKELPFETLIRVTNLSNGKSVVLMVTDRGPYAKGRVLDVTVGMSKKLGFYEAGHTEVRIEKLKS